MRHVDATDLAAVEAQRVDGTGGLGMSEAKAIKICYATITKGMQALFTESFVSAKRLGVFDVLVAELETSQKALLKFAQDGLQRRVDVGERQAVHGGELLLGEEQHGEQQPMTGQYGLHISS